MPWTVTIALAWRTIIHCKTIMLISDRSFQPLSICRNPK